MSNKSNAERSFIGIILQFAVGAMLAIGGIWALQGNGDFGARAIKEVVNGDLGKILFIAFGVVELLAGIFLILSLFIGDRLGKLTVVLMIIIAIVWLAAIVLSDFMGNSGLLRGGAQNFLKWLYTFASHLIVLAAILLCR